MQFKKFESDSYVDNFSFNSNQFFSQLFAIGDTKIMENTVNLCHKKENQILRPELMWLFILY